jgi:DNA-directed RNA polymerase subunit A"
MPAADHDLNAAIADDIESIVEGTDLPRRLKEKTYRVLAEKAVSEVGQAEQITERVEERYLDTRVDPLDPVGTVSAQSIGEPGTQMSLPGDERLLVREGEETRIVEIGTFVDDAMATRETRQFGEHEVSLAPDVEVLSLGRDEQVRWKSVEEVSRHEAPETLLRFELESGRTITATDNHSFVTRRDNEVVPVSGEDLDEGDWLPVVGSFDVDDGSTSVDLRRYLPSEDYWSTSVLTDGGTVTQPAGERQIENKRARLDDGDIEPGYVYPVGGTVGLPEEFPLTVDTGFFVGAWLAEGNATDYFVSVSNTDPTFQERIRSFADNFDLSVNEYTNDSGFAEGYDIRANGKVLADLLCATCIENGEKIVPNFAFGADADFVRGLLGGYLSGDGNVGRNSVRASSTSDRLTSGIALLMARVGVYATFGEQDDSRTLRVPKKYVPRLLHEAAWVGERKEQLAALAEEVDTEGPDATDQIPNFGDTLNDLASVSEISPRQVNSATKRQRVGRNRLRRLIKQAESDGVDEGAVKTLRRAIEGDIVWDRIASVESVAPDGESVYDVSVEGLETFTTAEGIVTHNTMNTFHYAGVAEIDVTQGLPRLIELVDARKTPDTPTMEVHLEEEYAVDRERAHEVVWEVEATRILALGDVSTNVADMLVRIDLNPETLRERWPTVDDTAAITEEIASAIESKLGVDAIVPDEAVIEFGPEEPSYRQLLQLVEELRDVVFKGIDEVSRVVIRKEEIERDDVDWDEEFVLYTEGSAFGDVLEIEGVDASRTTCNNIHEIHRELGIEAAREAIIEETKKTLDEQGLDDVNIRHLMLVADIMTNDGTIESIGRHGISGSKESVLARAAFEVTVNHLLDAAIHGEVDDLNGVTENVIVGKPIKLGTGDVTLRMGSRTAGGAAPSTDD